MGLLNANNSNNNNEFKQWRKQLAMSQGELANLLNVSPSTIKQMERYERMPATNVLTDLHHCIQCAAAAMAAPLPQELTDLLQEQETATIELLQKELDNLRWKRDKQQRALDGLCAGYEQAMERMRITLALLSEAEATAANGGPPSAKLYVLRLQRLQCIKELNRYSLQRQWAARGTLAATKGRLRTTRKQLQQLTND